MMSHERLGEEIRKALEPKPLSQMGIRRVIESRRREEAQNHRFLPKKPGFWSWLLFRPWRGSVDTTVRILEDARVIRRRYFLGPNEGWEYTLA